MSALLDWLVNETPGELKGRPLLKIEDKVCCCWPNTLSPARQGSLNKKTGQ